MDRVKKRRKNREEKRMGEYKRRKEQINRESTPDSKLLLFLSSTNS